MTYGVLRGLHYQMPPYTQAKLVRVIEGTVLDIVVDIRKGSPTFGRNVAVELSGENKRQLFAPRGMAHGFAVLSATATFAYKCDNIYAPTHDVSIRSTIRNSASTGRFRRKITCCRRRTARASRSTKPNICNGEN
ncbi:MAG: dTDP-4-dehydrorhamnose 3,5-epimerase [Victivallis sp.]